MQFLPRLREKPGGHEQMKEPSVFLQEYLHGDGCNAHSLISRQRIPLGSTLKPLLQAQR